MKMNIHDYVYYATVINWNSALDNNDAVNHESDLK